MPNRQRPDAHCRTVSTIHCCSSVASESVTLDPPGGPTSRLGRPESVEITHEFSALPQLGSKRAKPTQTAVRRFVEPPGALRAPSIS